MRYSFLRQILASLAVLMFFSSPTIAQQEASCQRAELNDPPRIVYQCANGLVLEAEAASALELQQQPGQDRPAAASISGKAVLIEVEPGSGNFQILTPHAIAAVRGTAYVVDVLADSTSVFVIRGEVAVSRTDGSQSVTLGPGQGVDVSASAPLTVKTWGQERVKNLLARFAR